MRNAFPVCFKYCVIIGTIQKTISWISHVCLNIFVPPRKARRLHILLNHSLLMEAASFYMSQGLGKITISSEKIIYTSLYHCLLIYIYVLSCLWDLATSLDSKFREGQETQKRRRKIGMQKEFRHRFNVHFVLMYWLIV